MAVLYGYPDFCPHCEQKVQNDDEWHPVGEHLWRHMPPDGHRWKQNGYHAERRACEGLSDRGHHFEHQKRATVALERIAACLEAQ